MCNMLAPQQSKVFFYQLITCSRIFLMKMIILYNLWRNILPIITPKCSLPCAQERAVWLYPEPDKYNPQLHTLFFKDLFECYSSIHAHVSQAVFTFRRCDKIFCTLWIPFVHSNIPHSSHPYLFNYLENIC